MGLGSPEAIPKPQRGSPPTPGGVTHPVYFGILEVLVVSAPVLRIGEIGCRFASAFSSGLAVSGF